MADEAPKVIAKVTGQQTKLTSYLEIDLDLPRTGDGKWHESSGPLKIVGLKSVVESGVVVFFQSDFQLSWGDEYGRIVMAFEGVPAAYWDGCGTVKGEGVIYMPQKALGYPERAVKEGIIWEIFRPRCGGGRGFRPTPTAGD